MNCTNCETPRSKRDGQWWHLSNYFGIYGYFCPICFNDVSHDSQRIPRHPEKYAAIKLRQEQSRGR